MIVDLRAWDGPAAIDTDLCIVGAGPAGLAVALEMLGSGHDVVVLAGGGLEPDADAQALYSGEQAATSHDYFDLAGCRARRFGGTSTMWSGRCARLAPEDFRPRDWVEGSGWPIDHTELLPDNRRSESLLRLTDLGFSAKAGSTAGYDQLRVDERRLRSIYFQI